MKNLGFALVGLLGTASLFVVGCDGGPGGMDSAGGTIETGGVVGTGGLVGAGGTIGAGGAAGGTTGTVATTRPIESIEATSSVNQRLDDLLVGLADTSAQLDTTGSTSVITQGINAAVGRSSACPMSSSGSSSTPLPASATDGFADFLRDVVTEAKDHVFREEWVELKDGNQVVYKVDPPSACGSHTTCTEKLAANPLRFMVTANSDDTLNVSLLVGAARVIPGTAVLGPQKLSIRADLAQAMAAVRPYLTVQEQQDLPEQLNGVFAVALEKRADYDFAISTSLLEKFDLLVGQAKGKPVAVTALPANPLTLVTLNSITNTVGYALNLGAVDVRVAGTTVCDDTCGTKERSGSFSGHLGGLSGESTIRKAATELTFSGLGLGSDTSKVTLNGDPLGTLDINPSNGRKLSVAFKKTSEGTLITFDPALDIKLAMMLNKLSDSLRVDMPEWLSDEVFDLLLGAAPKPSVLVPTPTCDIYGDVVSQSQLKVVSGNLSLSASSLPSPVSVAAGMCLLPVDTAASDAHPFSQVQAGFCP